MKTKVKVTIHVAIFSFISTLFFATPAKAADCTFSSSSYIGNGTNGTSGIHYFVNSITQTGSCTWRVPNGVSAADVLVVGGGGGGAGGYSAGFDDGGGAGGGGGAFFADAYPLTPGNSISVTVGGGGSGGPSNTAANRDITQGTRGTNSVFGSVSGGGGGAGGFVSTNSNQNGVSGTAGGGGGGSTYHWNAYNAGSGGAGNNVTVGSKTYTGVAGGNGTSYVSGAGNAGAGGGRSNAIAGANATPGAGLSSSITGSAVTYGGGGIGYGSTGWVAGTTQTGIGFGGYGGQYGTGGTAGANGIVIIRYVGVNINSFALAGNATTATYRRPSSVTINLTAQSTVVFYANGKRIPTCARVSSSGNSPNIIATCSWKPSVRGAVTITAISTPTGGGATTNAAPIRVFVNQRQTSR